MSNKGKKKKNPSGGKTGLSDSRRLTEEKKLASDSETVFKNEILRANDPQGGFYADETESLGEMKKDAEILAELKSRCGDEDCAENREEDSSDADSSEMNPNEDSCGFSSEISPDEDYDSEKEDSEEDFSEEEPEFSGASEDKSGKKTFSAMQKRDNILIICVAAFVVVALIVGLILGFATGGQKPSELTGLSFDEIKARVGENRIVPDLRENGYSAQGTLLFSRKFNSRDDMKKRENDQYIAQYEIVYTSTGGKGFVLTATNTDSKVLEAEKLTLAEGYGEPIYLDADSETKNMPIYVLAEKKDENSYVITLCFERKGQILGVSASYVDVDKAVALLKEYVELIIVKTAEI